MGLQPLPACDMSRRSNRSGLSRVPAAAISDRLDFILKRKDTLFLKVHFVDLGESFSTHTYVQIMDFDTAVKTFYFRIFLHPDGSHENGAKECIL